MRLPKQDKQSKMKLLREVRRRSRHKMKHRPSKLMLPRYLHRSNKQGKPMKVLPKRKRAQLLKFKKRAKQQSKLQKSMAKQLRHSPKSLNSCNYNLKLKLLILNPSL